EGDNAFEGLGFQDAGHGVKLVGAHHLQVALGDVGAGGLLGLHCNFLRVAQVFRRDATDGAWHGCREQGNLLVLWGGFQDLVDLFGEAHAQHFVGLIEDNVLQVGQVQRTLVDVVDYATWGTNNYLSATAQAVELRAVWRATVHWQNGEVRQVLGVGGESLGYLEGQLAGWSQNQDLRGLG